MTSLNEPAERQLASRETKDSLGSRQAVFGRLTDQRLDRAYRLAATVLDGGPEAQDAVHDAAVQAWLRWASLRDQDRFDSWFDRIVVNECRDRLRHNTTANRRIVDLAPEPLPDPDDRTGQIDALRRAIRTLSADHRIVIALRFLEDLPVDEIATRTGVRAGTVKSRIHYALRQLRAAYEAAERSGGSDR
jgi:RNA polymerase sigma-70 factor (ECF subfamily)